MRPFLLFHYRRFIGSISTFQHRFICLFFFVRLFPLGELDTFPCSVNSIFSYLDLDHYYRPDSLSEPVTHYGYFTSQNSNIHTIHLFTRCPCISTGSTSRSVHSQFRQYTPSSIHSNHIQFIDPRPITYTPHLWGAFLSTIVCHVHIYILYVYYFSARVCFSRRHRAFNIQCFHLQC